MVFQKGKLYGHPTNPRIRFRVVDIIFQCDQYADLEVIWTLLGEDLSGMGDMTYEDNVRIDSRHFDAWYDLEH